MTRTIPVKRVWLGDVYMGVARSWAEAAELLAEHYSIKLPPHHYPSALGYETRDSFRFNADIARTSDDAPSAA